MSLTHPIAAAIALLLTAWIGFAHWHSERSAWWLLVAGATALSAAAGGLMIHWSRGAHALVMLDQSASTRTAAYHDADRLRQRLKILLPDQTPAILNFSEASAASTIWKPVDAEAILLFSDGQFVPPPSMPPTWVIIDPALEAAADASIREIRRDDTGEAEVVVRNSGDPRELLAGGDRQRVATGGGEFTLHADSASATLSPGDAWPENDALPLPPRRAQDFSRWWIGSDSPPGWIATELPGNLATFASVAAIAVHGDIPLSNAQATNLRRYVTELGGGLLLIDSNVLPELSPLSFDAPTPQRRWIVLIDRSGSMAAPFGDSTRFSAACAAARTLLAHLPPNDRVAIAGVARDLNAWLPDATVADARAAAWPPTSVTPSGPTNIEPLLLQVLAGNQADFATHVILLTDSDAPIENQQRLADALAACHGVLHLLSVDANNPALADVARSSGGEVLASANRIDLIHQAEDLAKHAATRIASTQIRFVPAFNLPTRSIADIRPTWLRDGSAAVSQSDLDAVAAADWNRGVGKVLACSFTPTPNELAAFAQIVSRAPSDPRFHISINSGRQLVITARDADHHLNDLHLTLAMGEQPTRPMNQTAPGQYAAEFESANEPRVATVFLNDLAVAREIIPAHYSSEFDAVGDNQAVFQFIASRSGGGNVRPEQTAPLRLPRIERQVSLATPLAATAAACWLGALWRRKL